MPSQKIRDYESNGEPNIKIYNDIIAGLVYFVYKNQGSKSLRERVKYLIEKEYINLI